MHLDLGHPWVYDDEVANIADLNGIPAGTVVDLLASDGAPLGAGLANRQASIVVRRLEGVETGGEVTQEMLRSRLRSAFVARERSAAAASHPAAHWVDSGEGDEEAVGLEATDDCRGRAGGASLASASGGCGGSSSSPPPPAGFCRAVHGELDGLPGIFVDRFGSSAVVTYVAVGSTKLEFVVQEELTRWMGGIEKLAVHRMSAKKEKWAQGGAEFTTDMVRGKDSRIAVSEPPCSFEIDAYHGINGHWNYALEGLRAGLAQPMSQGQTVLDVWAHAGQWGIRCARAGATEVVLLEDSLAYAKLCQDNAERNQVSLSTTVLHRSNVLDELRNMAVSGIKFGCVALNIRVKFERYFKQRRGQFGKWFKPSLKGYETAVYLGAQVTSRGGYMVVTFMLPLNSEHWAMSLIQDGLARASRVGSMVFHQTALGEDAALASSAMEDAWSHVVVCVRLE